MQRFRLFRSVRTPSVFGFPRAPLGIQRAFASRTASSTSRWTALTITALLSGGIGYSLSPHAGIFGSPSSVPKYGSNEDFAAALRDLELSLTKEQISVDTNVLHSHGFSMLNSNPGVPHSIVVYPQSTEDVVKIVNIARKWLIPVVPYSGGTSLEGHTSGIPGGSICVDLSDMDKIIEVHEDDSDLVCQAGVTWDAINAHLQDRNIPLFFPLDPGPSAAIGGMMGTGCSGTNAVRYGTAKAEWFLNATVVLPSGEVIKTRQRARKSSAGFDATKLFIGAEGTLGIVTEVTIRLAPLLPTNVAVVQFPDVKKATEAVKDILNSGVMIQCVELCDDEFMRATNVYGVSEKKYPELDSLFFKFQGTPELIKETSRVVKDIVFKHGGTGFQMAKTPKQADDLWADRKNALYSSLALVPGARGWSTDVCVPVSKLPELVYETKKDLAEHNLVATVVGHVGDGNFHALILFSSDEELERTRHVVHRMVHRAIALEGTCTGEHGVGIGKKEYLIEELGAGTVELMKTVKRAIDPLGLFNPGKLYPDDEEVRKAREAHRRT
ncbi:hypothetical protein BS47DRAFT_1337778 [Hydnum rufescens UP504]|uniref:D-lactate dehydrogenase (cytochrome) n=1 Tax=Hydnum rufescens UP504 TaxID=1448309 RepID=A0A9P6B7W7_9AGAM|nr:hypothetical protein BS47DRAFT_1337778 [Hydnum rufescens UP504]